MYVRFMLFFLTFFLSEPVIEGYFIQPVVYWVFGKPTKPPTRPKPSRGSGTEVYTDYLLFFGNPTPTVPFKHQNQDMSKHRGDLAHPYKKYRYSYVVGITVRFVTETEFFNDLHSCVGSIISEKLIITAARCLYIHEIDASPEFIDVHFDTYMFINYTDAIDRKSFFRHYDPKYWIIHPGYDPIKHVHNIAIIRTPPMFNFPELTLNCSMNFYELDNLTLPKYVEYFSYGWNSNPLFKDSTVYNGALVPLRVAQFDLANCSVLYKSYMKKYQNLLVFDKTENGTQYVYCMRERVYKNYVFWRGAPLIFYSGYKGRSFTEYFGFMSHMLYNDYDGKHYVIVIKLRAYRKFIMGLYNKIKSEVPSNGLNLQIFSIFSFVISMILLETFK